MVLDERTAKCKVYGLEVHKYSCFCINEKESEKEACLKDLQKLLVCNRMQDRWRTILVFKTALTNWRNGQKERITVQ